MSRVHARVSLADDIATLEDLGSTNGTFLDDDRLTERTVLRDGCLVRVGSQLFRYERRERADVQHLEDLHRDLAQASHYVHSLLPQPLIAGPVRTEWRFVPSTQLGGDAFDYQWLDPATFAFYLIDVSGHGVGAAMHSVAVLNVLRQHALSGVAFDQPADVLTSLNRRFQMESHGGMFFTIWYGVYRTADRSLTYATAGHHATYLVGPSRTVSEPLGGAALMIGAAPEVEYMSSRTIVPPDSRLYLFSDGAFEIDALDNRRRTLADFVPLLTEPLAPGLTEADRLYQAIRQASRPGPLDDDCSLLVVTCA